MLWSADVSGRRKGSPAGAGRRESGEDGAPTAAAAALEARELKMLRDALGDEAYLLEAQFTSMYDSIKRQKRSCRVDSKKQEAAARNDFKVCKTLYIKIL